MTTTKRKAKNEAGKPSSASVDSMLEGFESMIGGIGGGFGGILGGVSRVASASLIRTQLERIADTMELETLYSSTRSDDSRANNARRYLREKIVARIEREALAEAGRAAAESTPSSDPRGMCPGGCGRKVIDGKRTCGEVRCGRTTP